MKVLSDFKKKERVKFFIPRSVQDVLPIRCVYPDGIFEVKKGEYSKTYRFSDINFAVADEEEKEGLLLQYMALLNALDTGAATKITIVNCSLGNKELIRDVALPEKWDGLDGYREEYNRMLLEKGKEANGTYKERYLTVTVYKRNVEEARSGFRRMSAELASHLSKLGSRLEEVSLTERLELFRKFYRDGEEGVFDLEDVRRRGHDVRDYIAPHSLEFMRDHFKMGDIYGRVLAIIGFASIIRDDIVTDFMSLSNRKMLSMDIVPVATEEAIREVEKKLLGVETNITNWQKRQNDNNNFSATVPYDMEQQRKDLTEFLNDLMTRDQKMMLTVLTMVITAETKEELDADTENLKMMMRGRNCEIHPLCFEQMEGLNTVLPFGVNRLSCFRTMTSESLAAFMPFHVQEVRHKGGCYYGQNAISRNLILADRKQLLNGNSFILGVSGAGKSFAAKAEIVNEVLSSDADILIIDPEREYSSLVKALGGEVIHVSASSGNHINAMEINKDYGEEANPVILKSEFVLSLCELLKGHLGAKERSILDRCTTAVYRDYVAGGYEGRMPTLKDLYRELLAQEEPEAKSLALEIELYAEGNLNTFAKETNVDTENRILCYDIADLGEQLMSIGMLVVLDSILNRITRNQKEGKITYVFIDEIYLLFLNEYSANFLFKLWKRVRKKGGFCTGITQDVEDLLRSPTARTMLANSEFILMLNQSSENRRELARLLHISEPQLKHVTDVGAGEGLMKIGKELIPFENHFPKNELYQLMTTKPGEGG